MKYCTKCGKEIMDEAVVCPGCGCAVGGQTQPVYQPSEKDPLQLLQTLSKRLNTNGIIWMVIGILQLIGGLFLNWYLLIVGVLNIVSSIRDMRYSKTVLAVPGGIVSKFQPLVGPIITLVYNLVIGGVIGVAGSIYYFVAIRNFVLENRTVFEAMDPAPAEQPPVQDIQVPQNPENIETNKRFCTRCGNPIDEGQRFCGSCGTFVQG